MAILIAIPPGIAANQNATNNLTGNLGNTITQTEATINQTLTQIQCSLTQSAPNGYGLSSSDSGTITGSASIGSNSGSGPIINYGGSPGGGESLKPMNESLYSDINNSLSDVVAIEPMLQVQEGAHNETVTPHIVTSGGAPPPNMPTSFNMTVYDYVIMGVSLNASVINNYPVLPTNITAGRNLQPGETGDVVLSENSSAYFGKGVGDTVDILGTNFKVVGIYSPAGKSDNQLVYMDLPEAQALTNSTGIITQLNVYADTTDDVNSVVSSLSALHPELITSTAQTQLAQLSQMESIYNSQLQTAQNTMNQTQTQAFEEISIAVVATSVIVLFVMLYTVRERTKEVGTLKAMGASNATVMSQFLVEGILLSVLAGVVAVVIGTVAAPYLSSILLPAAGNTFTHGGQTTISISSNASSTPAISVSPELMAIGFGASVLLGAIGSLYPAWRAARTRPAEAMRYE